MGTSLSSPQLGDGLVPVQDPNTPGPFRSAFTVDASDTNSFGFSASMTDMGAAIQSRYTDTANAVKIATCSAQIQSHITYTDYSRDDSGHLSPTGYRTDPDTSFASILCPVANTQIGTGPLVLSFGSGIQYWGDATYALYFGRTTATVSPEPTTITGLVPGQTTYLATLTSTVYGVTETVAVTTTLTGEHPATRCSALQISSPTTLSTSTRSFSLSSSRSETSLAISSASPSPSSTSTSILSSLTASPPTFSSKSSSLRISRQTSTTSASTSSSTSKKLSSEPSLKVSSSSSLVLRSSSTKVSSFSRTTSASRDLSRASSSKSSSLSRIASSSKVTSTAKTSTSSRTSTLSKSTSTSKSKTSSTFLKSSSSKTSTSSRLTSKSASTKATFKTTSSKGSSKPTSSSKIISSPVCSTGTALKSLSSYPSIASHLCQDILSAKQTFPSSISVWPASQLSSACSCYGKPSPTKISVPTKPALSKRVTVAERPYVLSNTDSTFSNWSSVSSSSTTLVPTTVLGYGPPEIYSVPTTTITTTGTNIVYITNNNTILPTTTTFISIDTTTVTTNSTVTIDQRILPTTCMSNSNSTVVSLSARSLTCANLELHTAFLWVMMKDPFDFCAYYLTANRNESPLPEMSASTLRDTCNCLVPHKSAPLPVFKVRSSYSPKPKKQCNQSIASLIKAKFKEPQAFCKYYPSTSRSISPFSMLKPGDVFSGCSCLI